MPNCDFIKSVDHACLAPGTCDTDYPFYRSIMDPTAAHLIVHGSNSSRSDCSWIQ